METKDKYKVSGTTEDEIDVWSVSNPKSPSCSAENNDNIEFVHNAEGGKE